MGEYGTLYKDENRVRWWVRTESRRWVRTESRWWVGTECHWWVRTESRWLVMGEHGVPLMGEQGGPRWWVSSESRWWWAWSLDDGWDGVPMIGETESQWVRTESRWARRTSKICDGHFQLPEKQTAFGGGELHFLDIGCWELLRSIMKHKFKTWIAVNKYSLMHKHAPTLKIVPWCCSARYLAFSNCKKRD